MSYKIYSDDVKQSNSVVTDVENWVDQYTNTNLETLHDTSMLDLASPDDSLVVVGPPRLSMANESGFYIIGMVQNFQVTESSSVQPLKPIGSRRHVFSRTNQPVQGNIGRMLVLGSNLVRALYALTDISGAGAIQADGGKGTYATQNDFSSGHFAGLDNDLFRIPIGLGIIYNSASTAPNDKSIGAEYVESCTLVSRSSSIQQGQTFIMEQVQFMGDRLRVWERDEFVYNGDFTDKTNNFTKDALNNI